MAENKDTIDIPVWWRPGGGMMFHRDALPTDHPEHTYNYIKDKLGKKPEDYGIQHPLVAKYAEKSRSELIAMIEDLEKELTAREFWGEPRK